MSKAIMVIDMPESCDMCDFVDEQYHYCNVPWFGKDVSDYVTCRHPECPLRELPQKKDPNKALTWEHKKWREGYNACINEILNGEEHETD